MSRVKAFTLMVVFVPSLVAAGGTASRLHILESYGSIPLTFEDNAAGAAGKSQFLARGSGYAVELYRDHIAFHLKQTRQTTSEFAMYWTGGSRRPRLIAGNAVTTTSNYFVGNDPRNWRTNVRNYSTVEYEDVYPGVNLSLHGNQRQLEYDVVLKRGADLRRVAFDFRGFESLETRASGDLVLKTSSGEMIQREPVSYYEDSSGRRSSTRVRYVLLGKHRVGLSAGLYDRAKRLVVDPILSYATYLGGAGSDTASAIAVDSAGNAYITGSTASTNFPTLNAAQGHNAGGATDIFVAKINAAGSALIYSTYLGGSSDESGSAIAVDGSGNAYITGSTTSSDFPTTANAPQRTQRWAAYQFDAFITKLNSTGSTLVFSTYLGGSDMDRGNSIALDSANNVYIAGDGGGRDFPVTPGAIQSHTYYGGFVAKLSASGTTFLFVTNIGGIGGLNTVTGVAVGPDDCAYVTGATQDPYFPTTPGAFQTKIANSPLFPNMNRSDAFVTKFRADGTALIYSTLLGGSSDDNGRAIAVDNQGNAYLGGDTISTDLPVTGTLPESQTGGAFIAKLNPSGSALTYCVRFGSNGAAVPAWATPTKVSGMALDASHNVIVTGSTGASDFPLTAGTPESLVLYTRADLAPANNSISASFVTKINSTATGLVYSTLLGSPGYASAVATDAAGNVYVAGTSLQAAVYEDVVVPALPGALQSATAGGTDAFITKLADSGSCAFTLSSYSATVDLSGGNIPVGITAPNSCNWIAVASVGWVAVSSGTSGAGNGSVMLNVQSNPGPSRTAVVSIAGNQFAISQRSTCQYSVNFTPPSMLPAVGGTGWPFSAAASPGCDWVAYSNASWLLTPFSEYQGNGNGQLQVLTNTGPTRTAIVTIADQAFTITQAGGYVCTYNVSPTQFSVALWGAQNVALNVDTPLGCIWTAHSNDDWITFLPFTTASGSSTLYINFAAPPNQQKRTGTLTVAGQTITVVEANSAKFSDFDANGTPDLVWQNETTRQVTLHLYGGPGGATDQSWQYLYPDTTALGWHVAAIADFNSDGRPDLVWQNDSTRQVTVHYYGGVVAIGDIGWNWLYPSQGAAGWHVVAAADFNGDGVPDLVWQNDTTRQVTVHYYGGPGGATDMGWNWLYPSMGAAGWHVAAASDFNGDGIADLVWQNDAAGQVTVHYYGGPQGATDLGWNWLYQQGVPGWKVVAAGDFDGNGTPDLVWQELATGHVAVDYYGGAGGATLLGWNWLYTGQAAGWTVK